MTYCHECGEPFTIDGAGIAYHATGDTADDYEADGDHVPFSLEEVDQ